MKDLQEILSAWRESDPAQLVLATVVGVEGSAYRRPGAHMLIRVPDRTFGMVSGGCLDNDLCERAAEVLITGRPRIVTYDSREGDDDTMWGLGLGCNGKIDILLETMSTGASWLEFAANRLEQKASGCVVTQLPEASRLFWTPAGTWIEGSLYQDLLARALRETPEARTTQVWDHALLEVVEPPLPLLLCGAGPDAVPVAQYATALGWDVTVVDHRPRYAERLGAVPSLEGLTITARTAAVVMAHHYQSDLGYLRRLLASPARYIGLLGPRKRTQRMLDELGEPWTDRLHAPIGLDLGADTPEEIALAILAEVVARRHRREGGLLRDRNAPIHVPLTPQQFSRMS